MRLIPSLLLAALISLLGVGCADSDQIPVGRWSGYLTPENHPEMQQPIEYEVRESDGVLSIAILSPDGMRYPARRVQLFESTLTFDWTEPEGPTPLSCTLTEQPDGSYAGPCTDPNGQSARFVMVPPE